MLEGIDVNDRKHQESWMDMEFDGSFFVISMFMMESSSYLDTIIHGLRNYIWPTLISDYFLSKEIYNYLLFKLQTWLQFWSEHYEHAIRNLSSQRNNGGKWYEKIGKRLFIFHNEWEDTFTSLHMIQWNNLRQDGALVFFLKVRSSIYDVGNFKKGNNWCHLIS